LRQVEGTRINNAFTFLYRCLRGEVVSPISLETWRP
jgi:hypothetical protein